MKIQSYTCRSAFDRPDYDKLLAKSYGTLKNRIAIACQLIRDGHTDCRPFDNCFEMHDGAKVVSAVIGLAMQDASFREALARDYPPQSLTNGLPTRWLETYTRTMNPLQLAA